LRVSPGPFNEEEDIEFFLNALSELVKDSGE
jgi:selenocysteine lyase/cysteine desulfurase